MKEIIEKRSLSTKTFDLGNGKFLCRGQVGAIHVPEDVNAAIAGQPTVYHDPDCSLEDVGDHYQVKRAWYSLTVPKAGVSFTYTSKISGEATLSLEFVGSDKIDPTAIPVVSGNTVTWSEVHPGIDIRLVLKPKKVEMFKVIKNANAARRFIWKIEADEKGKDFKISPKLFGNDNSNGTGRLDQTGRQKQRGLELTKLETAKQLLNGKYVWRQTETWTGRTIAETDPKTRIKSYSNEVIYPVEIDPTVNESIIADLDDVAEASGALTTVSGEYLSHYAYGILFQPYYGRWAGFRFQTINVPQGATIDSATLTIDVNGVGGAGSVTAYVYGDDVDDAAAWGASSRPSQITKTTAKTSLTGIDSVTTHAIDVQSIVQEIVDRASWVANNDMRFAFLGGTSERSVSIDDYAATNNTVATLDITYTAGGGTTIPAVEPGVFNMFSTLSGGIG